MAMVTEFWPERAALSSEESEDRYVFVVLLACALMLLGVAMLPGHSPMQGSATGVCERPVQSFLGYVFLTMH
jgi:hypothetical protein